MIRTLRDADERRKLQFSIANEIASLGFLVQTENDLNNVACSVLTGVSKVLDIKLGNFYQIQSDGKQMSLNLLARRENQDRATRR